MVKFGLIMMLREKVMNFQTIKSGQNLTGYKTDFVRPGHIYAMLQMTCCTATYSIVVF